MTELDALADGCYTAVVDSVEDGFATVFFEDDGEEVGKYKKGEEGKDTSHKGWPFDHPFYLIINQAVGGMLGGDVHDEDFPQTFTVKDIKIHQ